MSRKTCKMKPLDFVYSGVLALVLKYFIFSKTCFCHAVGLGTAASMQCL